MKKKFADATNGIVLGLQHPSIKIQFILAILAIIAGFVLHLTYMEWLVVCICIGLVIASEMLNTCIEKLCDLYTHAYNEEVKEIKDIAAGSVFVCSLTALIIAVMIFIKHII